MCPCCGRDRNELIDVSTNGAPCRPRFRSSGDPRRTREREQVVPQERLHRRMRSAVWGRLQPRIPGGELPRCGSPAPWPLLWKDLVQDTVDGDIPHEGNIVAK